MQFAPLAFLVVWLLSNLGILTGHIVLDTPDKMRAWELLTLGAAYGAIAGGDVPVGGLP